MTLYFIIVNYSMFSCMTLPKPRKITLTELDALKASKPTSPRLSMLSLRPTKCCR